MHNIRNIIEDNWFLSMKLLNGLRTGVCKENTKNKREMRLQFLRNKNRNLNASLFGLTQNYTLASAVPSMHQAKSVNEKKHITLKLLRSTIQQKGE